MRINVGASADYSFIVSSADMAAFIALSDDSSAIHTDRAYARSRGYDDVIVFGGIILAKLSHVLGEQLPGDRGISTRWSIDYRKPLLVGESASIRLEIVGASSATGLVDASFRVLAGDRLIATGRTQSIVPLEDIEDQGRG